MGSKRVTEARALGDRVSISRKRNGGLYSSVAERQSCKLKVLGSIPSEGCYAHVDVWQSGVESAVPLRALGVGYFSATIFVVGGCPAKIANPAIPHITFWLNMKWTHWGLNPGPSACEADVIPLHHVPGAMVMVLVAILVSGAKSNSGLSAKARQNSAAGN